MLIAAVIMIFYSVLLTYHLRQKRIKTYICYFVRFYGESGQVLRTLIEISYCYNRYSKTGKAIKTAIGYLETSAIADYKTAFALIEKSLSAKQIKEIHEACLKEEQKRKQYLLPKKGEAK